MTTPVTFRTAVPEDVDQLIDLMLVSSWGGIRKAWESARSGGESWQDRGRSEIMDRDSEIGFSRFVVAEGGGRLAGMVLLNLIGDTGAINVRAAPPEQVGALMLIRAARHSVFIREIATQEWARGQGLASELIGLAERVAATQGFDRVTLIVNDANTAAERLYRKHGFEGVAEQASLGHPHFPDGSRLMLMEKAIPTGRQKKETP